MSKISSEQFYCVDKVARPGSDLYYALRHEDSTKVQAILALCALEADLLNIVWHCQDRNLAMTKFAWWRKEIRESFQGQATHPVMKYLIPVAAKFNLQEALLQAVVDYYENLLQHQAADVADLQKNQYSQVSITILIAMYVLGGDALLSAFAHALSYALYLVEAILNLRRYYVRGIWPLASDDLVTINFADMANKTCKKDLKEVLEKYYQLAQQFYRQALQALPKKMVRQERSLLRFAKLRFALLDEVAQDGFPVLQQETHLTALRKLWLMWF